MGLCTGHTHSYTLEGSGMDAELFTFHCVWVVVWFEAWMETRTEQHISHEPEPWACTHFYSVHSHVQQWVWVTTTSFKSITHRQHKCMNTVWAESPLDQDSLARAHTQASMSLTAERQCVWCERRSPESSVWQTTTHSLPVLRHTSTDDMIKMESYKTDNL